MPSPSTLRSSLIATATFLGLFVIAFFMMGGTSGIKTTIFAQAIPTDYFEPFAHHPPELTQVEGSVYAFRLGFNRSLVVDTDEGLAVIDTFNAQYVAALQEALSTEFPEKQVKWVIHSHSHLDHIRGSVDLEAEIVLGHSDVNAIVADFPHAYDVAPVTRIVEQDETLSLGGVEIQFLYMQDSHSHTLFGFYIPQDNVVFAPDMMFVQAMPPFDFPDFYYPGYVRAMDRLIGLNAKHYVPSHFNSGDREDLIAFRNMTVDFYEVVKSKMAKFDYEGADGKAMRAALKEAYDELRPKYGDWHGFDAMFVPKFGRHWGGTYLGY